MPPCKHHEICGLDALEGEEMCILHSHNPQKDKKAFDKALIGHRKKKGNSFGYFVFQEYRDFRDEQFEGKSDFRGATFTGESDFRGAKFAGRADFVDATFTGEPDFSIAEFTRGAYFIDAKFEGKSYFRGAELKSATDFGCAKFTGRTDFEGAKFAMRSNFTDADFTGGSNFRGATFTGRTDFEGAKFEGESDFIGAEFKEGANFFGVRFLARTYFTFEKTDSAASHSHSKVEIDFRDVIIDPLDALIFRDADLQKCYFIGTDLRKAEFTGVEWPKIEDALLREVGTALEKRHQRLKQNGNLSGLEQVYERISQNYKLNWLGVGSRFGVYDEIEAVARGETGKYPHIERLYRELKQNCEDRRDYERASDFHLGEKEMRRKNPDTPRELRFLLTLYWLVSGYGERWIRPLIWAAGLLVVCAVLYLFMGLHPKNGGPALSWTSGWDWLESILYSIRVMTLLKPDDLAPDGLAAKFLNTIQSIVGPIILGLFGLAVRQRLKR